MKTEYRDTTKDWHKCVGCEKEFRNEDGSVGKDHNGKPMCPSCEDTHWHSIISLGIQ